MIESECYKGSAAVASASKRRLRSRQYTFMSYSVNADLLIVRRRAGQRSRGWLVAGALRVPCALGRGGVRAHKREGDGASPHGRFLLRRVWLRPGTSICSKPRLPWRFTAPHDGWCDDPRHSRYNRPVALPFPASAERMWRDDHLYDIVIEIGWNDRPAIRGRGSAIFMHLARPGYAPTEGCIALSRSHMLALLPKLSPRTRICIR
jgi:L,D-peptidoglycan transpeptidase YkuD (ErfK/YbiS/YcfS/YnhG family)